MDNFQIIDNKVSVAISNLTVPYLQKYDPLIIGAYLYPYKLGEEERIEIVLVHNVEEGISLSSNTKTVYGYTIYVTENHMSRYKEKHDQENHYRLSKELKNGFVIYDPKYTLRRKQNDLLQNQEIGNLYNFIELPSEVAENAKKMIYSINRKQKNG